MEKFAFEKLTIYQKSIEFALMIRLLSKEIKSDYEILDQMKRAALSISLNIAEGSGRFHKGDKKNFYYISRGSLFECIPIINILLKEKSITKEQYDTIYVAAQILAKMLTRLIQSVDKK